MEVKVKCHRISDNSRFRLRAMRASIATITAHEYSRTYKTLLYQILFFSRSLIGGCAAATAQTLQKSSSARLRGVAGLRDRSEPSAFLLRSKIKTLAAFDINIFI
jgi:hypothetical protein